jgi:hypothetical protein
VRLVQLTDCYILDLDRLQEVLFFPADGTEEAQVDLYFVGSPNKTTLRDDEAIVAWHRLRDAVAAGGVPSDTR